jgi:1-acyl-sn-glycerol-3-phosphate acyltransferase
MPMELPDKANGRHRLMYRLLKPIGLMIARYMRYRHSKTSVGSVPAVIISNHTTDYDPILVACSFREHMYFVASEHIFRWELISRLINYSFAPIPRPKGQIAGKTAITLMRLLKRGHNICIFGEGMRSYTGVTGPLVPSTGKLVKISGAQLITFRIEGGYFTSPLWGKGLRRGEMRGHFVRRYSPDELRSMTPDEINRAVNSDIYEDAYARQAEIPVPYRGKTPAEHIEIALYLCPSCRRAGSIRSSGSEFSCVCGLKGTYTEYGALSGGNLPFHSVAAWLRWQKDNLPQWIAEMGKGPLHSSNDQQLYIVTHEIEATLAEKGELAIFPGSLVLGGIGFPLSEVDDIAIYGRAVMAFTHKGIHYEIKSPYPRSALIYQDIFYALKCSSKQSSI